ncbi:alpha/beta fold hydrolase [Qipengyuania sp. DSG2-2]|uniref:alpha/beta fold hydrolase n=1 Tax=Qipengyuania sp. DGS2-2 TaxID=3349631 RepID=UPI0036D3D89C
MKRFLKVLAVLAVLLGVLFLVFRTPDTDAAEMRAKYGSEASQFVELRGGQTFHLRDEGPRDAPVVMLIHGANSSLHTWDVWTDQLKDNFRVVRFDTAGHGLTGPAADGEYTKARYVADIDAIADHLGLDTFVIAGNSMGGWMATSYAIAHPERVSGLALLNASGAPRIEGEGQLYLGAILASMPVVHNLMTSITPRSLVKSSYKGAVADPAVITEEKVDRYWELLRYPGNRQAVLDRSNTPRGGPFDTGDIAALTMPALVMWGDEDKVTPPSGADWYEEHLPNDRAIRYPDVAHVPMEEIPERSAADLRGWIEDAVVEPATEAVDTP